MSTDPDGKPYLHNAEQHEAHKAALRAEAVSVADIAPFWRYAVGPTNGRNPAIPFYRLASALEFFGEAQRELPWCGCIVYKRTRRGLVTIREYFPAPLS
jgi:hypothetical protein